MSVMIPKFDSIPSSGAFGDCLQVEKKYVQDVVLRSRAVDSCGLRGKTILIWIDLSGSIVFSARALAKWGSVGSAPN